MGGIVEEPADLGEYTAAAEWCAKNGHVGSIGGPLPDGLSEATLNDISSDIESFQAEVRVYAYAIAMDRINLPDM